MFEASPTFTLRASEVRMRTAAMLGLLSLIVAAVQPAVAQGKGKGPAPAARADKPGKGPKRYVVKTDRALVITKEVLVKRGFLVERIEDRGDLITVWYYRGNMG